MKILSFLIVFCSLSLLLSCGSQEDPTPDFASDLPIQTSIVVSQKEWKPEIILVGASSIGTGVSASNSSSFWNLSFKNNAENKIDFSKPFNIEQTDLAHPNEFLGQYGLKGVKSGRWIANKPNQLLGLEISDIYEDSGKVYCSGSIDFLTKGDQHPFTIRVKGRFNNVRFFTNAQDAQSYKLQKELELIKK